MYGVQSNDLGTRIPGHAVGPQGLKLRCRFQRCGPATLTLYWVAVQELKLGYHRFRVTRMDMYIYIYIYIFTYRYTYIYIYVEIWYLIGFPQYSNSN